MLMTDDKLMESRVIPALNEMYAKAKTVFPMEEIPDGFEFTFDNLKKYAPYSDEDKPERVFPLEFFYFPAEDGRKIIENARKGLRTHYIFPYRSEYVYSDEEISAMKTRSEKLMKEDPEEYKWEIEDLNDKIRNNDEYRRRNNLWKEYYSKLTAIETRMENKEIDRKQYNKELGKLAKEYGCRKVSRDGNRVAWTIFNYEPNSSEELFNNVKDAYNGKTPETPYSQRVLDAAKLAHDFVNNIKNNAPTNNGKQTNGPMAQ